jgi:hypothetical protein
MARGLERDPRVLVHSVMTSRYGGEGEYKIRGMAGAETSADVQSAAPLLCHRPSAEIRKQPPPQVNQSWQLAHRWVWNRAQLEVAIAAADDTTGLLFVCGIALNQDQMLDLFEHVFVLVIEADTQDDRLARATSPHRTEGVKQQIRDGRAVFQARMLAAGALPLDPNASPAALADTVLALV